MPDDVELKKLWFERANWEGYYYVPELAKFDRYITANIDDYYYSKEMKNMKKEVEQKELFHRCMECGEIITDANKSDLDDNLCKKCEDKYMKCEDCGKLVRTDSTFNTHDGRLICDTCRYDHYHLCDCCEELYNDDDLRWIEDTEEYLCDDCYSNGDYFRCDDCGNYYSYDVLHDSEDGSSYCSDCYQNHMRIMPYGTKVEHVDSINMFQKTAEDRKDHKLFYGIELEVCANRGLEDSVKHTLDLLGEENIIIKHDGSLPDDSGYEIVTAPMSYNRHHEFWRKFFEVERDGKHYAKDLSSFNTDCCGIHIHISRDALQLADICKIVFFVNEPTNTPFINFIASRGSNDYAQIKRKSLGDLQSISKFGRLGYNDRYEAVNLCNDNTIEIRVFKGTVEQISFFKNLEFVDCLIKFIKNKTFLQLSYDEFLRFLHKYKDKYTNLYNWIMDKDTHYRGILKECK